jgi:uncharacterized phage infection (PIP) family protein YhgE
MAKLFLAGAIFVTLLTGFLAFSTKSKVDTLQGNLSTTKKTLTSTQTSLEKTKSDLKKTGEDLATANKTVDDQKGQIGSLTTERDAAKKTADDLTAAAAEKDKTIADLTGQLKKIQDSVGNTGNGVPAEQVAAMTAQLAADKVQLADKQQTIDSMNVKMKDQATQLQTTSNEVEHYRKQIALHGFSGRIEAVNPGWNFVVINVGDKQGATVNSPLVIVRNGQNIGKAKITAVEPTTSIADVIPGSMARGQSVQPGDEVIFAGTRGAAPAAGAPAPSSGGGTQPPPLANSPAQ